MGRRHLINNGRKREFISLFLIAFAFSICLAVPAMAKVTGECVNCHTMHNSQGGVPMPGVGNITEPGPNAALTRGSCVGCHSNTGSETIKAIGSSRIPVVYNTVQPVNELAGGNFYWVNLDQANGHNVLTIPGTTVDSRFTVAPGSPVPTGGACMGCHSRIDNCTSCHSPYHHGDPSRPVVGSDSQTVGDDKKAVYYRFLANGSNAHTPGGVMGIEDPDWEQTVSTTKHNVYAGGKIPGSLGVGLFSDDGSMSNYCAGCHAKFHNTDASLPASDGSGYGLHANSPWLRHPNNYALPADPNKEYRLYNTTNGSSTGPYNPQAPIARPDILTFNGDQSLVRPGTDQVFCLSCHKPHGSPYKSILRWDYAAQIAGTTGPGARTGCFVCHTTKDGR